MNKELIANLAKQALVAANGIAEICCETPEEVEYFWQCIVENAGSTAELAGAAKHDEPELELCQHTDTYISFSRHARVCAVCGEEVGQAPRD